MKSEHYVEDRNLSVAWASALRLVSARGIREMVPLVVAITGFDDFGNFQEEPSIRAALEVVLAAKAKQGIDTVASTIFPVSMWNPAVDRSALFGRYQMILPRLRKASLKNRHGLYFERMISGGAVGRENQLDFIIRTHQSRKSVRRSVLQVAVFNPAVDHSTAAQIGFPCMQHVTFAPTKKGLCVNAFYATQYLVERAYGNYVGLCRLGRFIAHELQMKLARVTCFAGVGECELAKSKLTGVFKALDDVVAGDKAPKAKE